MRLFAVVLTVACLLSASHAQISFVCQSDNDIFKLFGGAWPRYDDFQSALDSVATGSGVLVLADQYPNVTVAMTPAELAQAQKQGLRVYVEFPDSLPGASLSAPVAVDVFSRIVVTSFELSLPKLTILEDMDAYLVPLSCDPSNPACLPQDNPLLVQAHVAGYNQALFGLPPSYYPVLTQFTNANTTLPPLLVATTKLSQLVTGRYSPKAAWTVVWNYIFAFLSPAKAVTLPDFTPLVTPAYGPTDQLPADAEIAAFRNADDWLEKLSGVVYTADTPDIVDKCPAPHAPSPQVLACVAEGFLSAVDVNGNQQQATEIRADCNLEMAMLMALRSKIDSMNSSLATSVIDYIYTYGDFQQGPRANQSDPAYGLIGWWSGGCDVFYGDDNARVMLATMVASAALGSSQWDASLLKGILGNFRTSGQQGFRQGRINQPDLEANGWPAYFNANNSYSSGTQWPQPHYQAYLWAVYLWAYRQTGFQPFYDRTVSGIAGVMDAYPAWEWTEYLTEELGRMLLPLAWLVRLNNTALHRGWLNTVVVDLLQHQQPSGAVQDWLGTPGMCDACPDTSNADHGTHEAPLIVQNGDASSDMLYSLNFMVFGLHEAAAATGDPALRQAETSLAEFLVRIQAQSPAIPYLSGAWFRAFDWDKWEYYGNPSDIGWGPLSVETGWTMSWISATLAFRHLNTTFWDFTASSSVNQALFKTLCPTFFPPSYNLCA